MDLFVIEVKPFRNIFVQFLTIMAVAIAATAILFYNGVFILRSFDPYRKFSWPVLLAMMVLSVFFIAWRKRKLEATFDFHELHHQVEAYTSVYVASLRWHLFSCLISCLLAIVTAKQIFLIYAFVDVLFCLPYYPTRALFRRELRNDEIIIH